MKPIKAVKTVRDFHEKEAETCKKTTTEEEQWPGQMEAGVQDGTAVIGSCEAGIQDGGAWVGECGAAPEC